MKQKFFTFFLALVASVGTMFAEKVKIGDLYYNLNATNKTAEVTSQNSNFPYWSTTIITANIPTSVTYNSATYSVTSIGSYAFQDCNSLTSVTIPNSVTSIGWGAFYNCWSLTSVTIPNSVTSIGDNAFYYCWSLTSVTIPNSVTSIGDGAFGDCHSLTSITIPNSVTSIGERAFLGCSSLTSVTIPNSVTSIEDFAFEDCTALTSVTIGNGVTSIGRSAFEDCSSLTSITIPNSVTSIGEDAFSGCSSLPYVILTALSEEEFCKGQGNSLLWSAGVHYQREIQINGIKVTKFTIPNSVTSIGWGAFYNCSSLTSVTIPNSVTSIGDHAFSGCSSLTSVNITDLAAWCNIYFGSESANPLYYAHNLYLNGNLVKDLVIPNSVTSIGNYAFGVCSSLTSVTIPNSVKSIGGNAFQYCESLTSVTIPNSVTSIGGYAFGGCSSLTSVTLTASSEEDFCKGQGNSLLYTAGVRCRREIQINGNKVTDFTIPKSVTSIEYGAFRKCSSLTSITIPNSVTSIGENAFRECVSLKTVVLGSSVKVLEAAAFAYCSSIETITCYSMRPPTVNQDALYGLDYSTIVYVPADYLNTYKMHDAWGLYDVRPLGATSAETEDVKITPSENEANVTWPAVSGAASYELVIKDKNGNIVCTLIFNANGQLTSIAFNAPSRNGVPAQTQNAGFSFTITGLDSGTGYDLTLTAKDNSGNTIEETTIPFHTDYPEGIEDVQGDEVQSTKVVKDGQVLILRGEKVYTIDGRKVH